MQVCNVLIAFIVARDAIWGQGHGTENGSVLCPKGSSNLCQTVVSIGRNVNFFRRIYVKRSYGLRGPWIFSKNSWQTVGELMLNGRGVRLRLRRSHDMTRSISSQFHDILNRDKSCFILALCKSLDTFTFCLHFVWSSLWFLRDLWTGPSRSSLSGGDTASPIWWHHEPL
jgi:hypothetical protein